MLIEAWKPMWGGGQVHVWELCQRLVEKYDCQVDLFVMNLKSKENNEIYPAQEEHFSGKLQIFRVGKLCSSDFLSRIRWGREVVKLISQKHQKEAYNLIHAMANFPGWPGKKLSQKLGIPIVYTVHGSGLQAIKDMYGSGLKSKFIYQTEKYLQTKIKYDYEITVDSSFLQYPNVNKNVIVIPNGVNIDKFDNIKINKCENFKIIWVGRLHPQKGLTYLLDALALIKEELEKNKAEVHLIGSGEIESELKEKCTNLGLNGVVKFRGKVYGDDLIKEYKSSHLFVLPSLYEGQPLTLLEAWAAKLPVLVTDVGGNKDFVVEGENGYIIPAKEIKMLAETLLKAVKNKELQKMGEEGYNLVKNNYTWDRMTEKTIEIYEKINPLKAKSAAPYFSNLKLSKRSISFKHKS